MLDRSCVVSGRSPVDRNVRFAGCLSTLLLIVAVNARATEVSIDTGPIESLISGYCIDCHNSSDAVQGVDLESVPLSAVDWSDRSDPRARWELLLKRIASRQMPPPDAARPSESEYQEVVQRLAALLDRVADQHPQLPPIDTLRRLTRTEYQNSVRDLLNVEIDVQRWIPIDESSQGFDNITVGELSPSLMSRYLTAAENISRIAVGRSAGTPMGLTVRLPPDLTQEGHLDGLPLGTRGGTNIRHTFAESGSYEVAVRLTRDRDEMIEGLYHAHDLDILLDRRRVHRFPIVPPKNGGDDTKIDANLNVRIDIEAGPHDLAVTFAGQGVSLLEIKRQPFDASYNRHRHPRQQPAIFEVSVVGPLAADGDLDAAEPARGRPPVPTGESSSADLPSRRAIFHTRPGSSEIDDQLSAAEAILTPLVRRAFRRQVDADDIRTPMRFFREAITTEVTSGESAVVTDDDSTAWQDRFEFGIERAIASILVNPNFLFRTEQARKGPNKHRISDTELASRLSYFLWSSLPDDELLDLAAAGRLHDPQVLRSQVARMLADPRSESLVTNFAAQWLYLRNLDSIAPDLRSFPDYDENLRSAFRQETQSLFREVMRRDASVLGLLQSDFTFLNQRLAKHYGIPGVQGSHFRKVNLPADSHRGGLLRHGSILAVTSYSTRTSPTVRGNWVLKNIIGTPVPPPPPDVPALPEKAALVATTFKERLAEHRDNPACASCHNVMDPVGFALDNFDALGRWRLYDGDEAIDSSGVLPDGSMVHGVDELERSLMQRPEMFVGCLIEKLMTFALGRGVDHRDAAAIRRITASAASSDFVFSSLIQGIVASEPFQYRGGISRPSLP